MRVARPKGGIAKAKKIVLAELAKGATITAAATKAGVHRSTPYDWKDADEAFEAEFDNALAAGADLLEAEARRRAVKGVRKMVVSAGQLIGYEQVYSDGLLTTLLKAKKRGEYGDRADVNLGGGFKVTFNGGDSEL